MTTTKNSERFLTFNFKPTEAEALEAKKLHAKNAWMLGFVPRSFFILQAQNSSLLIMQYHGVIVGFISFHIRRDGNLTLYEMAVAEEHRRKGWGCRMVQELIQLAQVKRLRAINLKCTTDNKAGQAFYTKLGFLHIGEVKGKRRTLQAYTRPITAYGLFDVLAGKTPTPDLTNS